MHRSIHLLWPWMGQISKLLCRRAVNSLMGTRDRKDSSSPSRIICEGRKLVPALLTLLSTASQPSSRWEVNKKWRLQQQLQEPVTLPHAVNPPHKGMTTSAKIILASLEKLVITIDFVLVSSQSSLTDAFVIIVHKVITAVSPEPTGDCRALDS